MAIRHTSAVAAASIETKLAGTTTSTSETVCLNRQLTEFQKCSLESELAFLVVLNKMTNEKTVQTCPVCSIPMKVEHKKWRDV